MQVRINEALLYVHLLFSYNFWLVMREKRAYVINESLAHRHFSAFCT